MDKPRSRREDLASVSTWRTNHWARWKPVEATQARESDHQSCSSCDAELWLILCVISVFIHHVHYSELKGELVERVQMFNRELVM